MFIMINVYYNSDDDLRINVKYIDKKSWSFLLFSYLLSSFHFIINCIIFWFICLACWKYILMTKLIHLSLVWSLELYPQSAKVPKSRGVLDPVLGRDMPPKNRNLYPCLYQNFDNIYPNVQKTLEMDTPTHI